MKLNPSIPLHAIIGLLTGLWGFIFGYFVRPFEHGSMDDHKWLVVSLGFSIAITVSYILVSFCQKIVYQKWSKWNYSLEVGVYIFFLYSIYAHYISLL